LAEPDPAGLENAMAAATGTAAQPACVRLFPEGPEALAALQGLIDQATCRIDVVMFYWENDAIGEDLAARLAAKAGPNLRVRVLIDGGGNLVFGRPRDASAAEVNRVVAGLARQPHVEVVRIRNPLAW